MLFGNATGLTHELTTALGAGHYWDFQPPVVSEMAMRSAMC